MKQAVSIPWWQRLFPGWKKAEWLRLLQQQRRLLYTGSEATAEIIDVFFNEEKIGNLLSLKLWIKLRKTDGSFLFTHTNTIVSKNHVPGKGEKVRVKFFPENLSSILIM